MYSFSYDQNLLSYSGEVLPAVLLSFGFYCFVSWQKLPKVVVIFASGVAVGTTLLRFSGSSRLPQ